MKSKSTEDVITVTPSQLNNIGNITVNMTLICAIFALLNVPLLSDLKENVLSIINYPFLMFFDKDFMVAETIILIFLLIPISSLMYRVAYTSTDKIEIANDRILHYFGVFTREVEELELYRIKDYSVYQGFLMRLSGIYNIKMITSDKGQPLFLMNGFRNGVYLMNLLRERVEKMRTEKGVKEFD